MKIAAVVILYQPDETALSNIKSYYKFVDKIFVFDNSENSSEIKGELLNLPKIEFHQDFKNQGISKRLNTACEEALLEQYDWILTMDQDSKFSPHTVECYFNCFHKYQKKEKVAMFGPNRSRDIVSPSSNCITREVEDLITSGTLLNLSLFREIGAFDEALFIDSVDRDYCVRSKMAGYAIIQFSDLYLEHKLGKQVYKGSVKTLFLLRKKKEIHSPLRCYYMYRNMLYLEKKYKSINTGFSKKLRKDVVAYIKVCMLYGRSINTYLKYIKMAKIDFANNKMGKIGSVVDEN